MQNIGIIGSDADAAELLAACYGSPEVQQAERLLDERTEAMKGQRVVLVCGNHTVGAQLTHMLAARGEENVEVQVATKPAGCSHTIEGTYYPTAKELAWLESEMAAGSSTLGHYRGSLRGNHPVVMTDKVHYAEPLSCNRYGRSLYTKPHQPSQKTRKAKRRRAKAGRKASR